MRWMLLVVSITFILTALPTPSNATAGDVTTFRLSCDSSIPENATAIRKMESHYLTTFMSGHPTIPDGDYGGCFGHVGIQNYFIGRDKVYRLDSATFRVTVTEVGRAPSLERAPNQPVAGVPAYPVFIESSLNGRDWFYVAHRTVPASALGEQILDNFAVSFPGGTGPAFRFLRARTPISIFDGLSGYADYFLTLKLVPAVETVLLRVTEVGPADDGAPVAQVGAARSCETDILEDPIAAHPCWYGGINHHDSVSSFHTYFIGDATLDKVVVHTKLGYFRYTDAPGGTLDNPPTEDGLVVVESSVDGSNWQKLGEASVPFAFPHSLESTLSAVQDRPDSILTFDNLGQLPARFIRVASGKTLHFDDFYGKDCDGDGRPDGPDTNDGSCDGNPGARRTAGYLLDSSLVLDGALPLTGPA
jgi:hypothetical protein